MLAEQPPLCGLFQSSLPKRNSPLPVCYEIAHPAWDSEQEVGGGHRQHIGWFAR